MNRLIPCRHQASDRMARTVACVLASCAMSARAQYFSAPGASGNWATNQTAFTLAQPSEAVLCQVPWNAIWSPSGVNLSIAETLGQTNGGCELVTLTRSGTLSTAVVPGASASVNLVFRISAAAGFEIDRIGTATGSMSGTGDGWFLVDQWCSADTLIRFIADSGIDAASNSLSGVFRGPMDPLTGQPVLVNESWSGSSRDIRTMEQMMFAPGRYELHAEPSGAFLSIRVRNYAAQSTAFVQLNHPAASAPPAEWDLDADGLVDLSDACLWTDAPTDADGDGDSDQNDLELLMAIARAGGSFVTDADRDGRVDQCSGSCLADFNHDENVDFFDVLSFLEAFSSGSGQADLNGDQVLDFFDLLAFLDAFANGC